VAAIAPETDTLPGWLAAVFHERAGVALRYRTEYRTFLWSYARLEEAARRAAGLYLARGLRPGDRLLIWGPNSPAYAAALLGCFLSGVVAVPIDARSAPVFLQRVEKETEARLVLRTRHRPDPHLSAPTILLEALEGQLATCEPIAPPFSVQPTDLAEILYTSGTTGRPKGTMLTQANLVAELEALCSVVHPIVESGPLTLLSILPLSHVFEQVIGFLLALRVGATVVYLETVRPSAIADALRSEEITAMLVVPRFLALLRDEIRRGLPDALSDLPGALSSFGRNVPWSARRVVSWPLRAAVAPDLRFLICGGAPLDPVLEQFWNGLGVLVLQGYGLTETSSAITLNLPGAHRVGTVGRVLPNQRVRLGNDDEILVQGRNVTPGYYRRPDDTRTAFVDGWFRTGDVGSFDGAGFLAYRGRLKDVIVTSAGLKVYPEDVEAVLDRLPGVRASTVVDWEGRVHAVLLLASEAVARARPIIEEANRHLGPTQQILGYTLWPGQDFPRVPAGKVRKSAVREALGQIQARGSVAVGEPAGRVLTIVAEVAHRPAREISPSDLLGPDLELDSIDRMELVMLIEEELGVDVDEEAVTANTTVRDLEEIVEERRAARVHERFPHWSRSPIADWLRDVIQRRVVFPFVRAFVALDVRGCENLAGLRGPAIFAANHTSRLDTPVVLMALPEAYRRRVFAAARAEFFEAPGRPVRSFLLGLLFNLVALVFGVFAIPQYRGFRPSLRYAGELVDDGESILVFPEGRQLSTDEVDEFKEGIGVLASALQVPVVPVRITGLAQIASGSTLIPSRRGRATIHFGAPLHFHDEGYAEITAKVESAVRSL
jgi:long-chain acyl-CoA synthetase